MGMTAIQRPVHAMSIAAISVVMLVGPACSNSSSRTTPSTSTSAGSTAGGSTTTGGSNTNGAANPTAPGLALGGPPPGTAVAPAPGAGTDVVNAELARVWTAIRPGLQVRFTQEIQSRLAGQTFQASAVEVDIKRISGIRFDISAPPGFRALDYQRVDLAVPLQGQWAIEIDAEVEVKASLLIFNPSTSMSLTVRVDAIQLAQALDLDISDPTRPIVSNAPQPQIAMHVSLRSGSTFSSVLLQLLTPVADREAQRLLADALVALAPTLQSLQGFPGAIPGDGAAALADSGIATPFEEVAVNVDRKIRQHHMPHNTLLCTDVDVPAHDSWLEAYRNGGTGFTGTAVRYAGGGDSAIWTGHYLAAQAFRYAVTQSSESLDNVRAALDGVGKLLDVNNGTGLLARVTAPENSLYGQQMVNANMVYRRTQIGGQTWVGYQGSYGVSRDQNLGVFFGLILAHDLVPDPTVRAEAGRRIRQILDYLIANDWLIDEDRPSFDGSTRTGFPTFWTGSVQKLAFLLMGNRVAQGQYTNELAAAGPLASTLWFGAWTSATGLSSYYKYNLAHVTMFNYFRMETDPWRWQEAHRAYQIMERYVGHHRNAHFDLIQTSIDPHTRGELFPSVRESMRRFLDRNHREVVPPVVDMSNVTWVPVPQVNVNNSAGTVTNQVQMMPSEPLDFHQRRYTGNFHWQRSPFDPGVPNAGNPRAEKSGLDVVLPYWMGRFMGAF